jgi:hypothetical protein
VRFLLAAPIYNTILWKNVKAGHPQPEAPILTQTGQKSASQRPETALKTSQKALSARFAGHNREIGAPAARIFKLAGHYSATVIPSSLP